MKQVKKWLFPVLTALIVAGAAVLPPGISQVRDARQFGQVHTEPLDASALPAYEPPGLLDRLALYAGQGSEEHPILSYNAPIYADDPRREEQMWAAWETLINGELVPGNFFEEEPYDCIVSRTLLWDPAASDSWQEPSAFVGILVEFHAKDGAYYKNMQVRVDEESGLPVEVHIRCCVAGRALLRAAGAEHRARRVGAAGGKRDDLAPRPHPGERGFLLHRARRDRSVHPAPAERERRRGLRRIK